MKQASGINIHCRHDAIEETGKVRPNPENPNIHPKAQIEKLMTVIRKNGWRLPITISTRSGLVTKGHGRLMAAKEAGWTHVPVEYQKYRSESEEWADVIADNQLSEMGETDEALVADALQKLVQQDSGHMTAAGYDEGEMTALLARLRGDQEGAKGRHTNPAPGPQKTDRKTIILHYTGPEYEEFERLAGQAMKDFDLVSVSDTLRRLAEEAAE